MNTDLSTSFLQSLGLESIGRGARVNASHIAADLAFHTLFSAASSGGAYNSGCYGAYGRLAAFQSLSALVGARIDDEIDKVAHLANKCWWVSFTALSGWFNNIAWDFGLLVVRPDRKTIAVLAATDTD
jgi:hypothetical protein